MRVIPIIKVCGVACNCSCHYCFYRYERNRQKIQVMNVENLGLLTKEFMSLYELGAEFDWHGGEPLLAGVEFFSQVVATQARYKKPQQAMINKIQTNGILVNNEWADFFKENDFQIGVSIDGPQILHDYYRRDQRGIGTFTRALKAYQLLKEVGVRVGIITVVHDVNSSYPNEMYNFFKDLGVTSLVLNPCKGYNVPGRRISTGMVTPEAYGNFMTKFFDRWFKDDNPDFSIRQFRNILQRYYGGPYISCNFAGQCQNLFTINFDGLVYPCEEDFFLVNDSFGHLSEGLSIIMKKPIYLDYTERVRSIRSNCLNCEYWQYCHGGCTRDYFNNEGQRIDNYFCFAWKKIFSHILSKVKQAEDTG